MQGLGLASHGNPGIPYRGSRDDILCGWLHTSCDHDHTAGLEDTLEGIANRQVWRSTPRTCTPKRRFYP